MNASPKKIYPESMPRHRIHVTLVCRRYHRLRNITLLTPLTSKLEQLYSGIEISLVAQSDIATEVLPTFSGIKHVYGMTKRGFKAKYKRKCDDHEKGYALTRGAPNSTVSRHLKIRCKSFAPRHAETDGKWVNLTSPDLRHTNPESARDQLFIPEFFPDSYQPRAKTVTGIFASATGARRQPGERRNDFTIASKEALPDCGPAVVIAAAVDEAAAHRTRASHLALATAGLESDA